MNAVDTLASPPLFTALAAVFGLIIGSFLNVVIHRLPKMMEREWQAECAALRGEALPPAPRYDLVAPRSACPACGHQVTARENVPVLSYLWLRGRCSACRVAISPRYPIVEAATGALTGYCAWRFGFGFAAFGAMLFVWCMIALTFFDIDTQLLPDSITLPFLWAGLLFNLRGTFVDLPGAAIGVWLGWKMLPLVILASSLVGAVVGVALIVLARRGRDVPIPFGPYLAGAGLIALFWGREIVDRYVGQLI